MKHASSRGVAVSALVFAGTPATSAVARVRVSFKAFKISWLSSVTLLELTIGFFFFFVSPPPPPLPSPPPSLLLISSFLFSFFSFLSFCLSVCLSFCGISDKINTAWLASREGDTGMEPRISLVKSHQYLRSGTVGATLPDAWRFGISARAGWSYFFNGQESALDLQNYFEVAAHEIVKADPS